MFDFISVPTSIYGDLVEDTEITKQVLKFKEERHKQNFKNASLGQNYWRGLKRRCMHIYLHFKEGKSLL